MRVIVFWDLYWGPLFGKLTYIQEGGLSRTFCGAFALGWNGSSRCFWVQVVEQDKSLNKCESVSLHILAKPSD